MDVNYEVENGSAQAIKPDVYMELVRDGSQIGDSQILCDLYHPVVYNEDNKFKKVHFEDIAKGKQDYTTQAKNRLGRNVATLFCQRVVVPETRERTSTPV